MSDDTQCDNKLYKWDVERDFLGEFLLIFPILLVKDIYHWKEQTVILSTTSFGDGYFFKSKVDTKNCINDKVVLIVYDKNNCIDICDYIPELEILYVSKQQYYDRKNPLKHFFRKNNGHSNRIFSLRWKIYSMFLQPSSYLYPWQMDLFCWLIIGN